MKTKYEFKNKALCFASKDVIKYDAVRCNGLYNDYEVYTPYKKSWKKNPPRIGLPRVILVNENEIKWDKSRTQFEVFDILHSCKKLPKVYFEYDCLCWYGNTYTIQLLTDGTLLKIEHAYSKLKEPDLLDKDKETVILKDKELLQDIKKVIKDSITVLDELPKDLSNNDFDDGPIEKIKLGKYRFKGSNIFTANYTIENGFKPVMTNEQTMLKKFQKIFMQVKKLIDQKTDTSIFDNEILGHGLEK